MSCFGDSQEDLAVLERLLDSPPAKFLGLGMDQLLTGNFRGVSRGSKGSKESGNAPSAFMEASHSKREHGGLNLEEVPNAAGHIRERRRTWDSSLVMTVLCWSRWCIRHTWPSTSRFSGICQARWTKDGWRKGTHTPVELLFLRIFLPTLEFRE